MPGDDGEPREDSARVRTGGGRDASASIPCLEEGMLALALRGEKAVLPGGEGDRDPRWRERWGKPRRGVLGDS